MHLAVLTLMLISAFRSCVYLPILVLVVIYIFLRHPDKGGNTNNLSNIVHRDGERSLLSVISAIVHQHRVGIWFYVFFLCM